jgi:hypothetical protein
MAPVDVQNTAVAAAWTVVAATQQAIPTSTPLPPTETPSPTPLPSFTPSIPTLSTLPTIAGALPTATQAAAGGECLGPINMAEAGPKLRVRIENETGGTVNLSLNLWKKNLFGQCGAVSTVLGKNEKKILELPRGSWWAYGWVSLKDGSSSTTSCSFELRVGTDDLVRLRVGKEACNALDA